MVGDPLTVVQAVLAMGEVEFRRPWFRHYPRARGRPWSGLTAPLG